MRLKAVDIVGFKSFSEPTRIEFHEGVTAIVGPNGSGKSNITDAIRWVLGEQGTTTLRAGKMVDVIFSGTQNKRALGFAEVTIYFDNEDGALPIDFADVAITRRYYRSGESEYAINGSSCRLKDIVQLFMDTGIGKDGYSIIGQGKVDQLLSPRGDDRRQVFDEASGIVKFKTRKTESLRKLEQTDQNILRLDDILGELTLRVEPLQKQAEAAKQFLAFSATLQNIETWHAVTQIDSHETNRETLAAQLATLKGDLAAADAKTAAIRDAYEQGGKRLLELEAATEQFRTEHDRVGLERAELLTQKSRYQLESDHAKKRIVQLRDDLALLTASLAESSEEDKKQAAKRESLLRVKKRYDDDLDAAKQKLQAALTAASADAAKRRALADELDAVRQQRFDLLNRKIELETECTFLQRQAKEATHAAAEQRGDLSRLAFQLETWQDELQTAASQAQAAEAAYAAAKEKAQTLQQTFDALTQRRSKAEADMENVLYRQRLLEDLERQGEGYPGVVKRIEKKRQDDPAMAQGIWGPLASLLDVDDGYAIAVEVALGAAANHIVADNQRKASEWIAWLKTTRGGRATFLPVAEMKPWPLEPSLLTKMAALPGYRGTAAEAVHHDAALDAIVGRLLGRTVIVEGLQNALDLFNKMNHMVRVVTLEGELLSPGGSMTGGLDARTGAGVIARKNELKLVEKRRGELAAVLSDLQAQLTAGHTAAKDAQRALSETEAAHLAAAQALTDKQHVCQQGEQRAAQLKQKQAGGEQEADALAAQISEKEEAIATQQTALAELDRLEGDLKTRLEQHDQGDHQQAAQLEDLREDVQNLRVSATSVEETIRALDLMEAQASRTRASEEARRVAIEGQIAAHEATIEDVTVKLADAESKALVIEQKISELTRIVHEHQERRGALEQIRHEAFEAMEKEGEVRGSLLAELERIESRRERLQNQIDELKNRLWEQYELIADDLSLATLDVPENMSVTKATREINQLRNKIKDLGPVNPAAIHELAQVADRIDELTLQRDDVVASRQELATVIRDLDKAMKEQFEAGFAQISASFTQVFRELFNGGDATLELEEADNLLESDIIIKAQPPGKKMQNLNPLSGGERSLTAIALLFAIMRLRPAPFCVFDEIESSLDDANVLRFADYIRKYAHTTQFVLVTHRKGTMESADRLYGVTMQERGISSILSMQLASSR